jgi:acid phosphatase
LAGTIAACASNTGSTQSTDTTASTSHSAEGQQSAPSHPNLNATLWVQSAAEYRALSVSVWRQALRRLDQALDQPEWTAALEQKGDDGISELPPAVIVDVDETVLDNSSFQARLVQNNTTFSTDAWHEWCREIAAPPVPGALGFAKYAADQGITVFYVTNRSHKVESATRKNLRKHGFPLFGERDVILTKHERQGWSSDKSSRRNFIADSHRILLMAGDNLGDFIGDTEASSARRVAKAKEHADKWGDKWFVLPNPTYGDWEAASYNYNYDLSQSERRQMKLERLDTRTGSTTETESNTSEDQK